MWTRLTPAILKGCHNGAGSVNIQWIAVGFWNSKKFDRRLKTKK